MFRNLAKLLIANLIALSLVAFAPAALVQPAAATGNFQSTMGLEFWVTFDNNLTGNRSPKLYLSGAQNAAVTITWPDATTQQETVTAGAVTTVDANAKINTANKYTSSADGISQTAVRVVSDKPISVYLLNQRTASSDASQAYPTEYQGYDYRVLTAGNTALDRRFSVIANETGTTTITVTPKVTLGSRTAGVDYTVSLSQGDVYSITGDVSGTRVQSDKKITVSSTNGCGYLVGGACDHMTEFVPPITTWGKAFVVPASLNTSTTARDLYRVMASQDNTSISINGVSQTLALAGDYYEAQIATAGLNLVVTADKPVLVMQAVMYGSYTDGVTTQTGDPSMVFVTPVVQYLNDLVITTPATGFAVNAVSLVVPTSDVGTATLDGTAIAAGDYSSTLTVGSATFQIVKKTLTLGTHTISSTNGVGVFVYGFNSYDSYAYGAAAGMVDLVQNPGGVAQVGYVAAAQVGNPNPPQQQAQQQVVAPPTTAVFFNRTIPVGTTGTIRLSGANLTGLTSLKIGDKTVEIVSLGDNFAEIKLPELTVGVYNISTTGTRSAGSWIGTQQLVLTVAAAVANPNPSLLKSAVLNIPSFAGGSAVLTDSMKAKISAEVRKYADLKSASCLGMTSGPTVLRVDASLAQRRAAAVCNYIASLSPSVITTTTGKNTVLLGGNARKVIVTLRF